MLGEDGGDLDSLLRCDLKGETEHKRRKDLTSCQKGKIHFSTVSVVIATTSEKGEPKWSCSCKL